MVRHHGKVSSVNISGGKGAKRPVAEARVDEGGLAGDSHLGPSHRQVSLLGQQTIDRFVEESGAAVDPGAFGENITLTGLDPARVSLLDRFRIGDDVELELTQIGKPGDHSDCAITRAVGRCLISTQGLFCRVLRGGTVRPGDPVEHRERALRLRVITLSDRASGGEYQDRSGPRVVALLEEFLAGTRWHPALDRVLLPDEPSLLRASLETARTEGVDVLFTCGSTGLGPRDIAPEVVTAFCERQVPGIMEHIRVRYGGDNPRARLSRAVAGLKGTMQVYAVPGSVRAVEEYVPEIVRTLEHILLTVHGIDPH